MSRQRVLFLCTANAARSQMAEGLARHLAADRLEVASAGSSPDRVHPLAVEVMAERGIDIAGHESKSVGSLVGAPFDQVVTLCDDAARNCPVFPGPVERLHWSLPDPARSEGDREARLAAFREVRDEIERRLVDWIDPD